MVVVRRETALLMLPNIFEAGYEFEGDTTAIS
jgi:hypothetical protein